MRDLDSHTVYKQLSPELCEIWLCFISRVLLWNYTEIDLGEFSFAKSINIFKMLPGNEDPFKNNSPSQLPNFFL